MLFISETDRRGSAHFSFGKQLGQQSSHFGSTEKSNFNSKTHRLRLIVLNISTYAQFFSFQNEVTLFRYLIFLGIEKNPLDHARIKLHRKSLFKGFEPLTELIVDRDERYGEEHWFSLISSPPTPDRG